MQPITVAEDLIPVLPAQKFMHAENKIKLHATATPMVHGIHKKIIKACIWINIILQSLYIFKNPVRAFKATKMLSSGCSAYINS